MGMIQLKGGSSAYTYLDDKAGTVTKYADLKDATSFAQLRDQYSWMNYHSRFGVTPTIMSDGFREGQYFYTMEKIVGKPMNEAITEKPELIENLMAFLEMFDQSGYVQPVADFSAYISRLKNHIKNLRRSPLFTDFMAMDVFEVDGVDYDNIDFVQYFDYLTSPRVVKYFESNTGICHGDFTLENLFLVNDGAVLKVIDSNYIFGGWNSRLLDISKLFQSLHYSYEETFAAPTAWTRGRNHVKVIVGINTPEKSKAFSLMGKHVNDSYPYILALEVSHYIRMLPYKLKISEGDFIKAYARLCQVYNDFQRNV